MKQIDILIDRLFAETLGVLDGTVNPVHALAVARSADVLIKAANAYSTHQRAQKKIPNVSLFDKDYTEEQIANQIKGK